MVSNYINNNLFPNQNINNINNFPLNNNYANRPDINNNMDINPNNSNLIIDNKMINNKNKSKPKNKSKEKNLKNKKSKSKSKNDKENISDDSNNNIKKDLKYLYLNKKDKKFRFSLSKYVPETKTGYYKCYDSQCKGRGKIQFNHDAILNLDLFNNKLEDNEKFILTKKHSKEYWNHSYKRKENILIDIKNNNFSYEKLKDFSYLKTFLREYCIINKNLSLDNLFTKLISEYPNIEISLTLDEKNKLIQENREKNTNNSDHSEIDINEIINIKSLLKRFQLNTNRFCLSKNNIKNLIMEMKDNHEYKLTTKLKVEFKRKNITYNKDIYNHE